ncbi:expressed unknown protein [Seminavis robusta]|uniref:Uncharacterized protein n=1 Tax=Seminavis robusta TaxID=568900 RepID=A0A9N8HAB4_9STRA|nr:expressed unknown protein [Seminavis robusta]|eukprot:Sro218_g090000.1 n/a (120) ;mRNA; f:20914-21273
MFGSAGQDGTEDWNHFQRKYGQQGKATKHLSHLMSGSNHNTKKQAFVPVDSQTNKNGGILKTLASSSVLLVQAASGSGKSNKLTKPGTSKAHFIKGSDLSESSGGQRKRLHEDRRRSSR